jgi:hypothetical protein
MIVRIEVRRGRDPQLTDIPAQVLWQDVRTIDEPVRLDKVLAQLAPVADQISFDPLVGIDVRIRKL